MKYKYNWDLEKYFYKSIEDKDFKKDLCEVKEDLENFIKKYKDKIKKFKKPEELLKLYREDEQISLKLNKIFHFVFYLNSLDTQDQSVIKKIMELENMFLELQNELVFVDEEFKKLWEEKLLEFSESKILKWFKYYLIKKWANLKYILSPKEERLLNEYGNIESQVENLYNEFHNSLIFEVDWKQLTEWEVRSMRSSKDPEKREKAWKVLREKYSLKHNQIVLSNIYSSFVKKRLLNIKLRKYSSVMEPRNISEDLPNSVVDLLIDQVIENYWLFKRYLSLKAKIMELELPLKNADIFAPVSDSWSNFSKEEAIEKYLEIMKDFDDDFYNYSIDLLKNWRVDFDPKKWKRWWAFASYSKWQESFVLLNFTWKLNDISTLAHEFGHAIHWHLSQVQEEKTYNSPLSLAETASIFNEMLLSESLIADKKLSKKDKIFLLETKLWEIFSTIFRQIQYIDFERIVHKKISGWWSFSYEDYCKTRRETQEKMSQWAIEYDVSPEEENGWSMIPHIFHTPFYCYSYAFWNILSFSLYWKYKNQWKDFIEDYKKILASWWSIPPKELLIQYGIDIESKEFFETAFGQISKMLDDLESVV